MDIMKASEASEWKEERFMDIVNVAYCKQKSSHFSLMNSLHVQSPACCWSEIDLGYITHHT